MRYLTRILDAVTGNEAFIPAMAVWFGVTALLAETDAAIRGDKIGIIGLVVYVIGFAALLLAIVNDLKARRAWDENVARAREIYEESARHDQ
jgi:hypothetical protein